MPRPSAASVIESGRSCKAEPAAGPTDAGTGPSPPGRQAQLDGPARDGAGAVRTVLSGLTEPQGLARAAADGDPTWGGRFPT